MRPTNSGEEFHVQVTHDLVEIRYKGRNGGMALRIIITPPTPVTNSRRTKHSTYALRMSQIQMNLRPHNTMNTIYLLGL